MRQRATPRFTHKRLSMWLRVEFIQRRFQRGMQRGSDSVATHSRKKVVLEPLPLLNLLLRLLQRNNRLKWMLKLRDFVALSNTENGRKRADWKYLKTWPRRAFLPGSME